MSRLRQTWQDWMRVLASRNGRRAFRRWRSVSPKALLVISRLAREPIKFKTIIDVGAGVGHFARLAAETYPDATIIAFEPLSDVADKLRSNLSGHAAVHVIERALGSKRGRLVFHRCEEPAFSSALIRHGNNADTYQPSRRVSTSAVPVSTLDDEYDALPIEDGPVLLRLDVEGYQCQVLAGAIESLKCLDFVLLGTPFRPHYQGEALFPELYDTLVGAGFRFLRALDMIEDSRGDIVMMEALFARDFVEP